MTRLVIVGCGLLGTSVALASRAADPQMVVVGVEPDARARAAAAARNIYTELFASIEDVQVYLAATEPRGPTTGPVTGVAATPPAELAAVMIKLAEFCDLVVDVGSVKAPVVADLEAAGRVAGCIVPCHPMAGSHQQGPAAGVADLLSGRWVFVVPMASSDAAAVQAAHKFWQGLGAQTQEIDGAEHDRAVAYTSHLPHLLASAYMGVEAPLPAAAGTGFMEFTRLAKANPEMWSQVLTANQAAWRPLLASYIESLQALDELFAAEGSEVKTAEVMDWLLARKQERDAMESGQDADSADLPIRPRGQT